MAVLNLLAPIFLIIALGAALQRGGMLAGPVVAGINKLLFWVGLPAAVFSALVTGAGGNEGAGALLLAMLGGTALTAVLAWWGGPLLGVQARARGTFTQGAFRSNLSFIALPLLLSVPGVPIGQAMLTFAPMLLLNNAVAVWVLLASQDEVGGRMWRRIGLGVVRNPIILASVTGLAARLAGWTPPVALLTTLQSLGRMALPLALLCIGAALMTVPVKGNRRLPLIAAGFKVLLSPLLGYGLGRLLGLDAAAMLVLLICLSCPTAAVSHTMVKQMGGDEGMAATTVVFASIGGAVSLAVVLAQFAG
ncbi:AEC family transporter [Actomonas aquatica]|uniref:AEC family transporter n=1 Tax=Actomonas aquatica TaxID=2866162 RepID=A0ABZ1C456_9BACT|nr:AEC family transporter [Opitutus sp. WL0086]WRQ86380.1 AEC family transporter [Opitutus sp. WL0086]